MSSKTTRGGMLAGVGAAMIAAAVIYVWIAAYHWAHWPQTAKLVVVPAFGANLLGVTLVVMGLGYAVTGLPTGFFMSSYYKYSLAKLQMALWTVLVVAALATAAEANIFRHAADYANTAKPLLRDPKQDPDPDKNPPLGPLDILIPGELLVAMGISLASLAGSSAVLALKGGQDPASGSVARMKDRVVESEGVDRAMVGNTGSVATNRHRSGARWANVVSGDEVANAGMIDLSKVQQLLVTLLLVLGYAGVLVGLFVGDKAVIGLPPLGSYAVTLLAISSAGYLAYKAAPKAAPGAADAPAAGGANARRYAPPAAPPPASAE